MGAPGSFGASYAPGGVHLLSEELSLAFLVMLERLSPAVRVVFVLRESFDFDYREIARPRQERKLHTLA
jgi:DNA-directed RNA polymerase specialized sigma24 family protein